MARRMKYPFLADFKKWVQHDRMISSSSSRTYGSCASAILTKLGEDITEDAVLCVLLDYEDSGSFSTYTTAWKAFAEWAAIQGTQLPVPDLSEVSRRKVPPLPIEALELLLFLSSLDVPLSQAARLRWGHISPKSDSLGYDVALPNKPGDLYKVPDRIMRGWTASWPSSREITGKSSSSPLVKTARSPTLSRH